MDKKILESIKSILSSKKKIILIPHSSPDADALGSCLALFHFFKDKHEVNVISPNEFTQILNFLPNSDKVLVYESDREKSDVLFQEAEIILGEKLENDEAFEMAGEKICSTFDIEACLITRGGDGMSFFCKDNTFHLKSNAKEIFDVSGAGDTVISAMATGLVMNLNHKQAAEFSNQAAGIVVGHIGTSAITTRELLNLN